MDKYKLIFLTIATSLFVFFLDINLKLGAAVPVLYTGVIWIISLYPSKSYILVVSISSTLLTLLGLALSPTGYITDSMVFLNRALGLFVIWLTYGFIYQRKSYEAYMQILSGLLEKTSNGAFVCNSKNQLIWSNKVFKSLAKIGKSNNYKNFKLFDYFNTIGLKDKFLAKNKYLINEELISEEFSQDNKDYRIDLELYKNLYENKDVLFGFIIDITETKKYQLDLLNYVSYIDSIVMSMPNPLAVISSDLKLEIFNKAFQELCSINSNNISFNQLHLNKNYDFIKATKKIEKTEASFVTDEVEIDDKNYIFYCARLTYNSNEPRYALKVIDVSDLKQALVDVENANSELKQFAYIASHDLQEPLRKISSFLQILDEDYGSTLPDDAKECIDYAVGGANRLKALIEDLLEFTALTKSQKNNFSIVDTNKSLINVLDSIEYLINETKTDIDHTTLHNIYGNHLQFEQVLQNLISNAIKYTSKDITPKISLSSRIVGGYIEFRISDNGIGIEEEFANKIFMIFKRLHSKEEYPGTGIGLAKCKRIVTAHGGKIWFKPNTDKKGTSFYFTMKGA